MNRFTGVNGNIVGQLPRKGSIMPQKQALLDELLDLDDLIKLELNSLSRSITKQRYKVALVRTQVLLDTLEEAQSKLEEIES